LCWCLWQKSGFSRREDVFTLIYFIKIFYKCCTVNVICKDKAAIIVFSSAQNHTFPLALTVHTSLVILCMIVHRLCAELICNAAGWLYRHVLLLSITYWVGISSRLCQLSIQCGKLESGSTCQTRRYPDTFYSAINCKNLTTWYREVSWPRSRLLLWNPNVHYLSFRKT
jgi:hypothetical protein